MAVGIDDAEPCAGALNSGPCVPLPRKQAAHEPGQEASPPWLAGIATGTHWPLPCL